jgi:hypothetical protein
VRGGGSLQPQQVRCHGMAELSQRKPNSALILSNLLCQLGEVNRHLLLLARVAIMLPTGMIAGHWEKSQTRHLRPFPMAPWRSLS